MLTSVIPVKGDPLALFLHQKEAFRGLYLSAEAETGYIRDRNVLENPISIEDTMCVPLAITPDPLH